jgi:hypothetical protein
MPFGVGIQAGQYDVSITRAMGEFEKLAGKRFFFKKIFLSKGKQTAKIGLCQANLSPGSQGRGGIYYKKK